MKSGASRTRIGLCLLLALVLGAASVGVPTPALAVERAMRVDTEVPAGVVAASAPGPDGSRPSHSRPETPSFLMLGVSWDGNETSQARVRTRTDAGWGPWTDLQHEEDDAPDPGSPENRDDASKRTVTRALWVGEAEGYELQAPGSNLRVHLVRESPTRVKLRPPGGANASVQPYIAPRATWGARPPKAALGYASTVKMGFVHHTAGTNSYGYDDVPRILRGDQAYHMDVQGWTDLGYNFVVDRFGRPWEGRAGGIDRAVIGAHSQGFNTGSTGVAVIGNFTSADPPPAALDAVSHLLGWKLTHHGVVPDGPTVMVSGGNDRYPAGTTVWFNNVAGHRDAKATECPGARLYDRLPQVRASARQYGGPYDAQLGANQQSLGGALTSGPGAASRGPGLLDAFVRGPDNALYHKSFESGRGWTEWRSLGGLLTSDPSAVSLGNGRVDVYVRGPDHALYQKWLNPANGQWSEWQSLGGALTSGPGVSSRGPSRLDAFVRGPDHAMYQKSYEPGAGWTEWRSLGGLLTSDPSAVSWGSDRIDAFVSGPDYALYQKTFDARTGQWSNWQSLGGALSSGPGVSSWGPARLDAFVRGPGYGLFHKEFHPDTGWTAWYPFGGRLTSDPAAVAWGVGRIDVFVRALDNALYQKSFGVGT